MSLRHFCGAVLYFVAIIGIWDKLEEVLERTRIAKFASGQSNLSSLILLASAILQCLLLFLAIRLGSLIRSRLFSKGIVLNTDEWLLSFVLLLDSVFLRDKIVEKAMDDIGMSHLWLTVDLLFVAWIVFVLWKNTSKTHKNS